MCGRIRRDKAVDGTNEANIDPSLSINLLEVALYVFIYLWRLRVIWKLYKRAS